MTDTAPEQKTTLTVTIDGREVEAEPGELLIAAAERHGTYIPRFCYHPRMRPVGMCRMCLVEVEGPRGPALQPSCMVPVADGMKVNTESPAVKKAQDGVLEFLLINHPLDCPVCDRGGECPLQDQTLSFGPGESRFVEEKRHWEKPIQLSPLVTLDRERCIQCDRCTRFQKEVAGDPLITFVNRGNHTEVNTFPDHPFASYFSGNTTQICPVGALLPTPYRFKARPWDLEQVESTCQTCAVGCRMAVQSSSNRLLRHLGIDVDPVNWGWLCDKGRFDFEAVNSDDRLRSPLVREGDALRESTWGEALRRAGDALSSAKSKHGSWTIGVLGGARLTNEDAYAWSKLARTVFGTDNVDAQLGDGLPAEVVLGLPRATIDEACRADAVVVLSGDLKEELPVLYLRLRDAVVEGHTTIHELSPVDTAITELAASSVRYRPGEAAAAVAQVVEGLAGAGEVVCVLGRPTVTESADAVVDAAIALAEAVPGVRFLSGLRRGNVHGALDMGLAPGMLPGRVTLDDGREWFGSVWSSLPDERGLDAAGMLAAAAEGRLQALVLLGSDPLADFPDRDLARRALAGAGSVIAVDAFLTDSSRQADVVLPVSVFGEKSGTTTNIEGRASRVVQKVTAPGTARPDWMVAADLALALGGDLGIESLDALTDEIARVAPAYTGVTAARLATRDGLDGIIAGRGTTEAGEGPPAMAQTESPEVHAVAEQGEDDAAADAGDDADDEAGGDEPVVVEAGPAMPPVLEFRPQAVRHDIPAVDSYSLRLVAPRTLYDAGVLVQRSPSLATLAPACAVRVNPYDLDRLGVTSGSQVRVISSRTSVPLPVEADTAVPRGVAVIPFNLAGTGAADLVDLDAPVTDIRLETL